MERTDTRLAGDGWAIYAEAIRERGDAALTDCPFCTIPQTGSEELIAHNDLCYLLRYRDEQQLGMMVIPYRHIETPFELTPQEWAAVQPLVLEAKSLLDRHHPDGYNMGWNIGRVGGQEVFHVHLHIFARFADEPFAGSGIRRWFKSAENRRPGQSES